MRVDLWKKVVCRRSTGPRYKMSRGAQLICESPRRTREDINAELLTKRFERVRVCCCMKATWLLGSPQLTWLGRMNV